MRMTKLSELVQQGRIVVHSGATTGGAVGLEVPAGASGQPHRPAKVPALSQSAANDDITRTIETLATHLLSISQSHNADPDAVLREALLAMEECITAIASQRRPVVNQPPIVYA